MVAIIYVYMPTIVDFYSLNLAIFLPFNIVQNILSLNGDLGWLAAVLELH